MLCTVHFLEIKCINKRFAHIAHSFSVIIHITTFLRSPSWVPGEDRNCLKKGKISGGLGRSPAGVCGRSSELHSCGVWGGAPYDSIKTTGLVSPLRRQIFLNPVWRVGSEGPCGRRKTQKIFRRSGNAEKRDMFFWPGLYLSGFARVLH